MEGFVLWLTGLPCAGKTTLATMLRDRLEKVHYKVEILDGDTVRQGLTSDLGFSREDRNKNIERVTYVAKLLSRNGVIVIASFVSPYYDMRRKIRREITDFIEVFVNCPLDVCVQRDCKGMYGKALKGEIMNFTGISDVYHIPQFPEITVYTNEESVEESAEKVLNYLVEKNYL